MLLNYTLAPKLEAKKAPAITELSTDEARGLLKKARQKIDEIEQSGISNRKKIRKQIAIAYRTARKLTKANQLHRALGLEGAKQGVAKPTRSSSPHLYLIRFVGLGGEPGSARRHADTVAACLNSGHGSKKTCKLLIKHGPTYMLKKYGVGA